MYSSLSNTDNNGNYLGNSARGATRQDMGSQQADEISRASRRCDRRALNHEFGGRTDWRQSSYNTNNLEKAIRDSMEDGSTYYTLGYYPENKNWDGRFRKIAVKVGRSGVKLHYRQGFFAVDTKSYARQDPKVLAMDIGKCAGPQQSNLYGPALSGRCDSAFGPERQQGAD